MFLLMQRCQWVCATHVNFWGGFYERFRKGFGTPPPRLIFGWYWATRRQLLGRYLVPGRVLTEEQVTAADTFFLRYFSFCFRFSRGAGNVPGNVPVKIRIVGTYYEKALLGVKKAVLPRGFSKFIIFLEHILSKPARFTARFRRLCWIRIYL